MDDAALAEFVDRAARAGLAIKDTKHRRSYLALLHRSLVDQMTAAGWLLMLAAERADAIIDQVRAAIIDQADGKTDT
jgi:hypothetical protein